MIPNVEPGQLVRASHMNQIVDAVNNLAQPLGLEWEGAWSEYFEGQNLPWHVDENTLSIYRPTCLVEGQERLASQYNGPSCNGPFYAAWNDDSSTLSVMDGSMKSYYEQLESSQPVSHWHFRHVFDLYPVSVEVSGETQVGPPCRAAHFSLCPIFGRGEEGQQVFLDMKSLNWKKISAEIEVDGQVSTILSTTPSAQIWDWSLLEEGDTADTADLTADPGWLLPIRPPEGDPHLKYVDLSTLGEALSAGCSCDVRQILTAGTLIAQWTNDGWQTQTDIYAPSSTGGGMTILGNVSGSTEINGDVVITNIVSSCISAWTGDVNGVPTLSIGAFYV